MQHMSSSCSQGISKALDLEDGRARRYFRTLAFICGSKDSGEQGWSVYVCVEVCVVRQQDTGEQGWCVRVEVCGVCYVAQVSNSFVLFTSR